MSSDGSPPASPPARRAPSARASKGNRMASLIAQEEDEREDDADKEFYEQDFWADAEEDAEYAMEADDEGADSFDSDFGDSSESDGDDGEEEEKAARKAAKPKKRSVYVDPKARADKQAAGEGGAGGGAAPRPRKRPRSELAGLDPIVARGSLRASTKDATAQARDRSAPPLRPRDASRPRHTAAAPRTTSPRRSSAGWWSGEERSPLSLALTVGAREEAAGDRAGGAAQGGGEGAGGQAGRRARPPHAGGDPR